MSKAIPGGSTGRNSAWKFRTDSGYRSLKEMGGVVADVGSYGAFRPPTGEFDYPVDLLQGASGASIFDPVLCELAYRWFCPPGGRVLDPFAGGSVRGIVASVLGYRYWGCELRDEQVTANRAQAEAICSEPLPAWHIGDARGIVEHAEGRQFDFLFTCPPYGDLERYSDDPRDVSTLDYPAFIEAFRLIVAEACALLLPDRFAAVVVGDFRDKRGLYRGFPADTQGAFMDAGLGLYNEAILITAAGSLPIRAGGQFRATRKLGKTHQNMLVFVKGDPKSAALACGAVPGE